MTLNRLINIVINRFMGQAIDIAARGGKAEADLTDEERLQARKMRQSAKNARKTMRAARRATRF